MAPRGHLAPGDGDGKRNVQSIIPNGDSCTMQNKILKYLSYDNCLTVNAGQDFYNCYCT